MSRIADEQYAKFGAAVAGIMDSYLLDGLDTTYTVAMIGEMGRILGIWNEAENG